MKDKSKVLKTYGYMFDKLKFIRMFTFYYKVFSFSFCLATTLHYLCISINLKQHYSLCHSLTSFHVLTCSR